VDTERFIRNFILEHLNTAKNLGESLNDFVDDLMNPVPVYNTANILNTSSAYSKGLTELHGIWISIQ
jgi:hypothetical protein